jgi:superfamily II DNA helicase RecQ
MPFSFHWIPARDPHCAEQELNAVLQSRRVVAVERHFCPLAPDPGWAVCVEFVQELASESIDRKNKRTDYREVLDGPTFKLFAAIRQRRKDLAAQEGLPIFAVLNNEQLAEIARQRCSTLSDLRRIKGLGEARIAKYGEAFLQTLREAIDANDGEREPVA